MSEQAERTARPVVRVSDETGPRMDAPGAARGDVPGTAAAAPEAASAAGSAPAPDAAPAPGASDACAEGPSRCPASLMASSLRESLRGHEHAFLGGVAGLLVAVAIYAVGIVPTLVTLALVALGVALGQLADGDPKLIELVRRLFSQN